jgi:hypothetical protein
MQAQYDDNCLSRSKIYEWIDHFKKGRTLYARGRDQEGCQRQGVRTVFKPLEERYGKTDESHWTTLRRLPYVWPNERSSKRKKISSDKEVIVAVQNCLKTQPKKKKLFSYGIKNTVKL